MPCPVHLNALVVLFKSEKYIEKMLELYKDTNPFLYAFFLKLIKDIPEQIKCFDKKNNTECFQVFTGTVIKLANDISCNDLSDFVSELLEIIDQYCYEEVEIHGLRFKTPKKQTFVEYLILDPIMIEF